VFVNKPLLPSCPVLPLAPNNADAIRWLRAHFTLCLSPKHLSYEVHTVWVTHAWSSRKNRKMEGKYSPRKKSIKISRFPNPFSLMFLCKFVRWEWNCLITLQTWRASLKKITYLSKQGGIYVGVPEMWFYSGAFFASIFPFCFLIPLLSSVFIASDSKLPYNNPAMIAAMISTSVRPFQQAHRWFPRGPFRKVRVTFGVLPSAGQGRAGYESPVNVPSRRWHASWN